MLRTITTRVTPAEIQKKIEEGERKRKGDQENKQNKKNKIEAGERKRKRNKKDYKNKKQNVMQVIEII